MAKSLADKMLAAADWLNAYGDENDPETVANMREVAAWLVKEADRRDKEASIRAAAKEYGVPVKAVREVMAKHK